MYANNVECVVWFLLPTPWSSPEFFKLHCRMEGLSNSNGLERDRFSDSTCMKTLGLLDFTVLAWQTQVQSST